MNIEFAQIVTQIISFLIMVWVLKRFAWKPILNVLDERKNKIKSDFDFIEEQKKETQSLIDEYKLKLKEIDTLAQSKMQDAIKEGQHTAYKIQQEAHKQAKSIIAKAEEELQKEIAKAKIQLKEDIVNIALMATEKFLETKMNPNEQKQLIEKFVKQEEFH